MSNPNVIEPLQGIANDLDVIAATIESTIKLAKSDILSQMRNIRTLRDELQDILVEYVEQSVRDNSKTTDTKTDLLQGRMSQLVKDLRRSEMFNVTSPLANDAYGNDVANTDRVLLSISGQLYKELKAVFVQIVKSEVDTQNTITMSPGAPKTGSVDMTRPMSHDNDKVSCCNDSMQTADCHCAHDLHHGG